jgi:hypothetical protein
MPIPDSLAGYVVREPSGRLVAKRGATLTQQQTKTMTVCNVMDGYVEYTAEVMAELGHTP